MIYLKPKIIRFKDDRPVRLLLYWQNKHLTFFKYGVNCRSRKGVIWTHYTFKSTCKILENKRRLTLEFHTWKTKNGVHHSNRVTRSKRYFMIKGLF